MVSLLRQSDFRSVQNLDFCYLCGRQFVEGESKNRDHIPPECIFLPRDREPLWLPTHTICNKSYGLLDEKIGQLIALRYGKVPTNPTHRRLKFAFSSRPNLGAVVNLDIDGAVWRWVAGFHAALYRESPVGIKGSLVTPFLRARRIDGRIVLDSIRVQHRLFVQTIKSNRAWRNLDSIHCNKGKLIYESVWCQSDGNGPWLCIFALDLYDWKDLGNTGHYPARGCAGYYALPSGSVPTNATKAVTSSVIIPNSDPLDPFGK